MKTWKIWILSRKDIEHTAERLGYKMADFSTPVLDRMDRIAHQFRKAVECACEKWDEWLDEAVMNIAEDQST